MLHVMDYKPSSVKPLAEVKEQVVAKLQIEKAAEKAHTEALAIQNKVSMGQSVDDLVAKLNAKVEEKKAVSRFGGDIPASLAQAVFKLAKPADKAVSAGFYADDQGNQSVLILEKVYTTEDTKESQLKQGLSQQLLKLKQEEAYGALIEHLRAKADIKYAPEAKELVD